MILASRGGQEVDLKLACTVGRAEEQGRGGVDEGDDE